MSNKHKGNNPPSQPQANENPAGLAESAASTASAATSPDAAFDPQALEQYRRETKEAMAEDLMMPGALVPDEVAAVKSEQVMEVPKISEQITGKISANDSAPKPVQTSAQRIFDMLEAGKITPEQATAMLQACGQTPYIGGADGPATRDEIRSAVEEVFGPQMQNKGLGQAEMLELMGTMVEKIVKGLREPSEEEKLAIERKKRSRARVIQEQFEAIRNLKLAQDYCPHERATIDGRTHSLITAVHNYADNQTRGICGLCGKIIEPTDPEYHAVKVSHYLANSAAS